MTWNYKKREKGNPGFPMVFSRADLLPITRLDVPGESGDGEEVWPVSEVRKKKVAQWQKGCLGILILLSVWGMAGHHAIVILLSVAGFITFFGCVIFWYSFWAEAAAVSHSMRNSSAAYTAWKKMENKASPEYRMLGNYIRRTFSEDLLVFYRKKQERLKARFDKARSATRQQKWLEEIARVEKKIWMIVDRIDASTVDIFEGGSEATIAAYGKMCDQFEKLCASRKIWHIYGAAEVNHAKSSASTEVERREVKFSLEVFPILDSLHPVPCLTDRFRRSFFLYPNFIVRKAGPCTFEISALKPESLCFGHQLFHESMREVPRDGRVVSRTYTYVNKDGTPDRRFADNPVLQVLDYGVLELADIHIKFYISHATLTDEFAETFARYMATRSRDASLQTGKGRSVEEKIRPDF